MAKVTIVLSDRDNDRSAIDIAMEFDPPLPENQADATMAQNTAVFLIAQSREIGDLAVSEFQDTKETL